MIVKNITDLTEEMTTVFNELRAKKLGDSEAKQLANVAGKLISACKTKMEYNKMIGNKKPINFLADAK